MQIETTLIKKDIDEFNDENFVELMRLENGKLEKFVKKTDYNTIRDELDLEELMMKVVITM